LEWIPTLLKELLVLSRILSLLRLLLKRTSTNLSLRTLQCRRLCASTQARNLRTSLHTTREIRCNDALLPLSRLKARLVGPLIDGGQSLSHAKLLLTTKDLTLHVCAAAAKGTSLDGLCLLLGKLLTLLLLKSGLRRGQRRQHCRVLVVANLFLRQGANISRARKGKARSCAKIRLR
jgi:hypothetical protein